ncbi:MAG: hypothetical protein CMJ75_19230 [Planctomycetaceae bacterium]|nr:hypothetical protein [Planctomycetaceae bacterium]
MSKGLGAFIEGAAGGMLLGKNLVGKSIGEKLIGNAEKKGEWGLLSSIMDGLGGDSKDAPVIDKSIQAQPPVAQPAPPAQPQQPSIQPAVLRTEGVGIRRPEKYVF